MKPTLKSTSLLLAALLTAPASASAANFVLSAGAGLITPTGRGGANSIFAGWDTFSGNPPNAPDFTAPINDSTPDLPGSAVSGALIVMNNGQDHITGSGNYYSGTAQTNETITIPVVGALAAGFTTIIAQGISAPGFGGSFGTELTFSSIAGVAPVVTVGANSTNTNAFFVAVWEIPGSAAASHAFTLTSPAAGQSHNSFDKITLDAFWSANGFQGDTFEAVPEPGACGLAAMGVLGLLRRRRA